MKSNVPEEQIEFFFIRIVFNFDHHKGQLPHKEILPLINVCKGTLNKWSVNRATLGERAHDALNCYGGDLVLSRVWLLWPHGLSPASLLCPWDSSGKNTGVVCRFLLQGIFLTQGSNPGLLHCSQIVYHLSYELLWDAPKWNQRFDGVESFNGFYFCTVLPPRPLSNTTTSI